MISSHLFSWGSYTHKSSRFRCIESLLKPPKMYILPPEVSPDNLVEKNLKKSNVIFSQMAKKYVHHIYKKNNKNSIWRISPCKSILWVNNWGGDNQGSFCPWSVKKKKKESMHTHIMQRQPLPSLLIYKQQKKGENYGSPWQRPERRAAPPRCGTAAALGGPRTCGTQGILLYGTSL